MSAKPEADPGTEADLAALHQRTAQIEQRLVAAIHRGQQQGDSPPLGRWWVQQADAEVQPLLAKARAYGSNSLAAMGRWVARLQGRRVTQAQALELGCWIYAVGKFERMADAILRGEPPSDDCIHDARVYLGMIQRVRTCGDWPGPTDGQDNDG